MKQYNPKDYVGPENTFVSALSRDALEQELCRVYDLLTDILDANTLKDIGEKIEFARKEFEL